MLTQTVTRVRKTGPWDPDRAGRSPTACPGRLSRGPEAQPRLRGSGVVHGGHTARANHAVGVSAPTGHVARGLRRTAPPHRRLRHGPAHRPDCNGPHVAEGPDDRRPGRWGRRDAVRGDGHHGLPVPVRHHHHRRTAAQRTARDLPERRARRPERIRHRTGSRPLPVLLDGDLSAIPSGSVDLVFSGESIEHVTRDDCERVLAEARRVLKPSGSFCFDTPNRALTRLQVGDDVFINPDHRYEYTHPEMVGLLTRHGFEIAEAKGITLMPETARTGVFDLSEMMTNVGVYDDIEECYLLYYRCRPRQ